MRKTTTVSADGSEIISDGRTVWVNRPLCLARFGPICREFFVGGLLRGDGESPPVVVQHAVDGPTLADWEAFVESVKTLFGIDVSDKHKPGALREES